MENEHYLQRTGLPQLCFCGVQIAESRGRHQWERSHARWYDLRVYRTSGGKFVVASEYHTNHREPEFVYAVVVPNVNGVVEQLLAYDPVLSVRGYPAGERYAERQARLLDNVRLRYQSQVSEILGQLPLTCEEVE